MPMSPVDSVIFWIIEERGRHLTQLNPTGDITHREDELAHMHSEHLHTQAEFLGQIIMKCQDDQITLEPPQRSLLVFSALAYQLKGRYWSQDSRRKVKCPSSSWNLENFFGCAQRFKCCELRASSRVC